MPSLARNLRNFPPAVTVAAATTLFAIAGCGGSDSNAPTPRDSSVAGPVTARELQIVAGDGQSALRGDDLHLPLQVRVVGSDGKPMSGVTVTWAPAAGAALVDPASAVSDATGMSATYVRDIAALGNFEVRATAGNASPASFAVQARDPCLVANIPSTRLDSVVNGMLRQHDCDLNGLLFDVYAFTVPGQHAVTIRASSGSFDPWVVFFTTPDWFGRATYAGEPGRGEASMRVIVPGGLSGLGVTSGPSDGTGPYVVTATLADEDVKGCELVVVVRGIATDQHLTSGDCVDAAGPRYSDTFIFNLRQGESIRIVESSSAFVPRLQLVDTLGAVVAEAAGDHATPATIDFTVPGRAYYVIVAGSTTAGATGDYRLALSVPPKGTAKGAARAQTRDSMRP